MDSEFTGKSFREALEIIFYDPKDAEYTTRQIDTAEKLHEALLASEKQTSYKTGYEKGYIDAIKFSESLHRLRSEQEAK